MLENMDSCDVLVVPLLSATIEARHAVSGAQSTKEWVPYHETTPG